MSLKPVVLLSFEGRKNLLMVPKRWLRRSQLYEIFHVFVFLLVYLVILGSLVIHRGKLKISSVWYDSAEAPSAWHSKPRSKCSRAVPKAGYLYRSPTWTHIPHNDQWSLLPQEWCSRTRNSAGSFMLSKAIHWVNTKNGYGSGPMSTKKVKQSSLLYCIQTVLFTLADQAFKRV